VLPPELAKNSTFLERFRREADIAARLDHPNMVRAIEAGESGGFHYFAMEFVEGESVYRRLKREGVIPEGEALQIARHVSLALQHAHDAGLVHRDIKPDNIFLAADGQAKLGDLGLARSTGGEESRLTQTGVMVGTPHYVSPEQARGSADVDTRSDIYSLGATLYHMVTGQVPFEGDTAMAVLNKHLNEELPWPADVNDELTDEICLLIAKMMAKDPADRYQEPLALTAEIDRVLRGEAPVSRMLDVGRSSVKKAARARKAGEAAERRRRRLEATPRPSARSAASIAGASSRMMPAKKSSAGLVAGVVGGAALLVIAALIVMSGPGEPETPLPVSAPPKPPARTGDEPGKRLAEAYGKADAFWKANPEEYEEAIERFAEAGKTARGTEWQKKAAERLAEVKEARRLALFARKPETGVAAPTPQPPPRHAEKPTPAVAPAPRVVEQPQPAPPTDGAQRLGALLDEVDASALAGRPDAARGKLAAAKGEKALAGFAGELAAAAKVVDEIEAAAKAAKAGFAKAVGRKIEVIVGGRPKLCKITRVHYDAFDVEREVRMGGRKTMMSTRVRFADLDPKALDALKGKYEPKTPDGHVAASVMALAKRDLAAAGASLGRAGEHALVPRYQAKLVALRPKPEPAPAKPGPAAPDVNLFADFTAPDTYFLDSRDGSDANDGTTWSKAWKSFDKVYSASAALGAGKMIFLVRGRGAAHPYLSPKARTTSFLRWTATEGAHVTLVGVDDTGGVVLRPRPEAIAGEKYLSFRKYGPRIKVINIRFEGFTGALDQTPLSGTEWIGCRFVLADSPKFTVGTIQIGWHEALRPEDRRTGVVVRDCLFVKGGGVVVNGLVEARVEHCTFVASFQRGFGEHYHEKGVPLDFRTVAVSDCLFADMGAAFSFHGQCTPATLRNCYLANVTSVGDKRIESVVKKIGDAGFADPAGGDYSLSPRSALKRKATDGTDVGYRPAEGMKAATAFVCRLMGRPVPGTAAGGKVEILYREGWEKAGKHGWGLGNVVEVPGRGKVFAADDDDKPWATFRIQSNYKPHIPVAHGAYLSFWYYLEKPSPSMVMNMANTVEGHKSFSFRLGRDRPLVAGKWSFFSIKIEEFVSPAGGHFADGDMCKQLVISGKERPAPKFMIDDVTISKGGLPPDAPGARESTPAGKSTRIGGINFGRAKVRRLRGGMVEAVWEFDAALDPEAWYLWNTLPRDAGGGSVRMVLRKPAGSPCHPSRAMAPRVVFDGDLEVEAVFTGVSGRTTKGKTWPLPTVSICSAAPARGARPCARFPQGGSSSGFTGEYWGKIAASGKSLPKDARGAAEAVVKLVRRGTAVECSWSASRTSPGRSIGKASLPPGPVGVDVGLYHVWALGYSARLERLRVTGRPAGLLTLPDAADAVPRKGSAAALMAHGLSIDSRTSPEAHAVWRALVLRYPSSAREVGKALHSLNLYGAPGEAVKLWEKAKEGLPKAEVVRVGIHRNIATAYAMMGMKDEAVACYKLGGLTSGFDIFGLASVHFLYGEYDDAIKYYEMDIARSPTDWRISTAWWRLGECYRAKGDPAKALECYRNVLAKFPGRNECAPARKAIAEIEATGREGRHLRRSLAAAHHRSISSSAG